LARKGLPKSIIKKYGVTKKAWAVFRGETKGKHKSKGNPSNPGMAKYKTARRAAGGAAGMARKLEKGVGASRIAERLMNILGFPPDPYKSAVSVGAGFVRGGIPGGIGAIVFSSNILEMLLSGVMAPQQGMVGGEVL